MHQRATDTLSAEYPPGCELDGPDLAAAEDAIEAAYRAQDLAALRRALQGWVGAHRRRFAAYRAAARHR
jgi:hypothetical protein